MSDEIVMITGERGTYDFDTEMKIESATFNLCKNPYLSGLFRNERDKSYKLQKELDKIKSSKGYKLLKFFKLI